MDFDDLADDDIDYECEFEVLNSEDSLTVTLVCRSSRPLTPDEFADVLRTFAGRIEINSVMSDAGSMTQ